VPSSIVLIAPAEALPELRERLDSGAEMHTFTDHEALEALDFIIRAKPRIVALEQEFSGTSRGRALINRIGDDPSLQESEIRVVAQDGVPRSVASRRSTASAGAALAVDEPQSSVGAASGGAMAAQQLDGRGTRRAPRVAVRDGVEVLVDGNAASLVDMSSVGVQVVSQRMLRPNQRVRVTLSDTLHSIRCEGTIAWASYEMPKGEAPRYRAGIELTTTDQTALRAYAERHKKP
jgi:hypothetical protein